MKIAGCKIYGQDSALTILDFDKKEIFAVSGDRVSRIKKDNYNIDKLVKDVKTPDLSDIEILSYPFQIFGGNDSLLETKGTSYFWLKLEAFRRLLYEPKYRNDVANFNKKKINLNLIYSYIKSPKILLYLILRNFFWFCFNKNLLNKSFHEKYVNKIITDFCHKAGINSSVKIEKHDHETSHAYSAYYLSPFTRKPKVCVFTIDEHGDESCSKSFIVKNRQFDEIGSSRSVRKRINYKYYVTSIGSIYSNFTEALGFIRSSDEGKVEALAAFGKPIKSIINDLKDTIFIKDYSFAFNEKKYWKYCDEYYLASLAKKFKNEDLARTIQDFLELIVVSLIKKIKKDFDFDYFCIAGGVAANVIMNLKLYEECRLKNIFVCPPMGDEGSALGAAIKSAIENKLDCDWISNLKMPYYGPSYTVDETEINLKKRNDEIKYRFLGDKWPLVAGKAVASNKIIGLFNGRMEFGPRALGNRSIIANPFDNNARLRINNEIKRRHKFQPFCPSVLEEDRLKLFKKSYSHKHMAIAFRIKKIFFKSLSSAIHIDGTARPQFVEKNDNLDFYNLIKAVKKETGFGIVINTSFNLHGRPVVYNVNHAIDDFLDCGLDKLFINGFEVSIKE